MSSAKAEADGQAWRDRFHSSSDGLSLHIAEYGDPSAPWLPVVCLPGLSRSARDFHNLAVHLSTHRHRPRRVLAFDYRGRGLSQWDKDIANYNPLTELTDVLDGMSALGIGRAIVVGTSRGGIIAMMMGVARPHAVAGVVLNDIGPVIEPVGLARIKTYIGRTPAPDDWDDAIHIIKRLHGGQFTALGDAEWEAFARATYRDEDGRPAANYDPALAKTAQARDWIVFHTGAPITEHQSEAAFAVVAAPQNLSALNGFSLGTQEFPDRSTSVILQVTTLTDGAPLLLEGPGIKDRATLAPAPMPHHFTEQWMANRAAFPRGIDLILAGPGAVAAMPRSTRLIRSGA